MGVIKLNIRREKALIGFAMPYRISINGSEKCKLFIGKSCSLEMQNAQSSLKVSMVGNAINFHNIEKEIALFPHYCKTGVINCNIRTRINWVGYLTLGLFQAMAKIELDIEYC